MKLTTFVLAGLAAFTCGALPAQAAPALPATGGLGIAPLMQSRWDEGAVRRAFQSVLRRDPTPSELRRYQAFMEEYNWTEADVRRDLQDRPDYQTYTRNRSLQPEAIIRRAYRDILDRNPDPEGMSAYRSKIIDQGWSEQDVREALRNSPEYQSGGVRNSSADRIVRRAYQDVLHRDPDPAGLEQYRRNIVERGWDEQDVRTALRRSPESRGQVGRVSLTGEAQAADMVRRAYRSVLNREPDDVGLRDYTAKVVQEHWTERQIMDELRRSDEYRSKH
jgi:hypothetical protein